MKISTLSLGAATLALALSGCGEGGPADGGAAEASGIDFGTNASMYANDGECDDVRFEGSAMPGADERNTDHIGQDAADCIAAFDAGTITLNPLFEEPASTDAIVYGDDAGNYPNDGDCDDIRFTGDYASNLFYMHEDIGHDASDCRAAVESGEARWQGATATPEYGITLEEAEAMEN